MSILLIILLIYLGGAVAELCFVFYEFGTGGDNPERLARIFENPWPVKVYAVVSLTVFAFKEALLWPFGFLRE